MDYSNESSDISRSPDLPSDGSKGSSISSSFENEYDELLKYAIVAPKVNIPKDLYSQHRGRPTDHGLDTILETSQDVTGNRSLLSRPAANLVNYSSPLESSTSDVNNLPSFSSHKRSGNIRPNRSELGTGSGAISLDALLSNTTKDLQQRPNIMLMQQSPESLPSSADTSATLTEEIQNQRAVDIEILRMDQLMNDWCGTLKNNVMEEFSSCKLNYLEKQKEQSFTLQRRHGEEVNKFVNEIESLKELLHTFELSVKQKDSVIGNLTGALQKQRDKTGKVQSFLSWRIQHINDRREVFASKLAHKHHQKCLTAKVWAGWRSIVESKWKLRVEKACQARAQEVCVTLTEDYEARIKALQHEVEEARRQVAKMHCERDMYEETMKKAFMRGVCALNMEAMHMFKEGQTEEDDNQHQRGKQPVIDPRLLQATGPSAMPTFDQYTSNKQTMANQQSSATTGGSHSAQTYTKNKPKKQVTIHATGKRQLGTMSRPSERTSSTGANKASVSSVLVQRHLPEERNAIPPQRKTNIKETTPSCQPAINSNTIGMQTVKVVE